MCPRLGEATSAGPMPASSARGGDGTICFRLLALGARMRWYRTRLRRGGGTGAASFSINSKGDSTK